MISTERLRAKYQVYLLTAAPGDGSAAEMAALVPRLLDLIDVQQQMLLEASQILGDTGHKLQALSDLIEDIKAGSR